MIGIFLQLLASGFVEISETIGKNNVRKQTESVWVMGFLNGLCATVGLVIVISLIRGWDSMTLYAWPTLLIRMGMELVHAVLTLTAIVQADRSTYGFIRVGTIPLIILVEMLLFGVFLSGWQIIGILLICTAMLFLALNHGLSKKGIWYVLIGTVMAAVQIPLFRYNITHGNSVELEQLIIVATTCVLFLIVAKRKKLISTKILRNHTKWLIPSSFYGLGVVIAGYAFLFAPASVLTATARAAGIMAAVLAGHWMFKEKHFVVKIIGFIGCAAGVILLALGAS